MWTQERGITGARRRLPRQNPGPRRLPCPLGRLSSSELCFSAGNSAEGADP